VVVEVLEVAAVAAKEFWGDTSAAICAGDAAGHK